MGPVRRRLSLGAVLLMPSAAMADVCATHRPDWLPGDGAVSAIGEAFHLFTSIPGLAILGAFVLALTRGKRLDWLLTAFLPLVIGVALAVGGTGDITRAMQAEGCAGPAGLSVTLCILLALVGTWQSLRKRHAVAVG